MSDQAWYRALRHIVIVGAADMLLLVVAFTIVLPRWETLATWQQAVYWCLLAAFVIWAAVALWRLHRIARARVNARRRG